MQKVRKLAVVFTICSEFLPLLFAHPLFLHSKSIHGALANKQDRLYTAFMYALLSKRRPLDWKVGVTY